MHKENQIVHGLWIGRVLSPLELLTLHSFTAHGHRFTLWTYGEIETPLPEGVTLADGRQVLPEERIFRYEKGPYPGSIVGFSDVFRYELLARHGGWWVDLDVTCLAPFDLAAPYVFRPHHALPVIANIMKMPAGCELARFCCGENERIGSQTEDWFGPTRPLIEGIEKFRLRQYVVDKRLFGLDDQSHWRPFFVGPARPTPGRLAIHWCNEWLRELGFDKRRPIAGSFYYTLLHRYGLLSSIDEVLPANPVLNTRRPARFHRL